MGGQHSSMRKTLEDEFVRLHKTQKDPEPGKLSIEQLIQIQLPHGLFNLDLTHLGVLWVLDRSKTGSISQEDLFYLAKFGESRLRCYQRYEFQSQIQGLGQVVHQAAKANKLTRGDDQFYREDIARMLHTVFKVNETQGVEFGDFWAGLREAGQEMGLLRLDDEQKKSWVPRAVIAALLQATVAGMSKVLDEVFPMDETVF